MKIFLNVYNKIGEYSKQKKSQNSTYMKYWFIFEKFYQQDEKKPIKGF